nr:plant PDR ABC transporter associated [Tanacetum cinerariifolium]
MDDSEAWISWGFYVSPMMYAQNALVLNEFLDKRWSTPNIDPLINSTTVGEALLKSRSFFTKDYSFWICIGALLGFSVIFNLLVMLNV